MIFGYEVYTSIPALNSSRQSHRREKLMTQKTKILFLCTGNSCRSQMAEGFVTALQSNRFEAYSAGIETHGMNPRAVQVMREAGVDISSQHSKTTDQLPDIDFDYVVTLCGHADRNCPFFPAKTKITHHGFDDPPTLARSAASEKEILDIYRRVRNEIKLFVENLPRSLNA